VPLAFTDNHLWHFLTLTTKGPGKKGMNLYIDGVLEADAPRTCSQTTPKTCIGIDRCSSGCAGDPPGSSGGDPIDPVGEIRLCGRQKGGAVWNALYQIHPDDAEFDPKRYFRGKVAHIGLWNVSFSANQVQALLTEYRNQYNLPGYSHPPPTPPAPVPLTPEEWKPYALDAQWRPPCDNDLVAKRMRRLQEEAVGFPEDDDE